MSILSEIKLCLNKKDFLLKLNVLLENKSKGYCCVLNPNIIVTCYKDKSYFNTIKLAAFNICDAISVELINNFTKKRKIKSVPGPDIFIDLARSSNYTQFFIGGENEDQLSALKNNLNNSNFKSKDFYCPPFLNVKDFNYIKISKLINKNKPDIIWIGLGAPKQEVFMSKLLPHIHGGLLIGVGAAFNFYSGYKNYKRAPKILRKLKLEWLYRIFSEPRKTLPRILRNIFYLPLILVNELFNIK